MRRFARSLTKFVNQKASPLQSNSIFRENFPRNNRHGIRAASTNTAYTFLDCSLLPRSHHLFAQRLFVRINLCDGQMRSCERMSGIKIEDEVYECTSERDRNRAVKDRRSKNDNRRFLLIKNSAMLSNLSTFPWFARFPFIHDLKRKKENKMKKNK